MVTILYRYVGSLKPKGGLTAFTDHSEVSAFALDGLAWSVEQVIIGGKSGNRLDSGASASRAEVSAVFERLIVSAKYILTMEIVNSRHVKGQ